MKDIVNLDSYKPGSCTTRPITAILHLASPLINSPSDLRRDVLDPAIHSATAILEAARRYGGDALRRIVHTSSCAESNKGRCPGVQAYLKRLEPDGLRRCGDGRPRGSIHVQQSALRARSVGVDR
ncbi:hypothetical protein BDV12DRAFT_195323 [Aspergillus spectabilis]